MPRKEDIRRHTLEDLERMESRTDWERVDRMTEEELEAAIAADPDWRDMPADWHEAARPFYPRDAKRQVTLRLDPDILDWFRRQGPGYQTRINAALRAFVEAHGQRPK